MDCARRICWHSRQFAWIFPSAVHAEEVLLGDPSLTAGVPGKGPITMSEIETWLDDERNFIELNPRLPLGLSQGSSQITGLDENPLTRAKIELGRQLFSILDCQLIQLLVVLAAMIHQWVTQPRQKQVLESKGRRVAETHRFHLIAFFLTNNSGMAEQTH